MDDKKKFKLNKLYFASKRKINDSKERIKKTVGYCFANNHHTYIFDKNIKEDIINKLSAIDPDLIPNNALTYSNNDSFSDLVLFNILTYMFKQKKNFS